MFKGITGNINNLAKYIGKSFQPSKQQKKARIQKKTCPNNLPKNTAPSHLKRKPLQERETRKLTPDEQASLNRLKQSLSKQHLHNIDNFNHLMNKISVTSTIEALKLIETQINNPAFGHSFSQEQKNKLSKAIFKKSSELQKRSKLFPSIPGNNPSSRRKPNSYYNYLNAQKMSKNQLTDLATRLNGIEAWKFSSDIRIGAFNNKLSQNEQNTIRMTLEPRIQRTFDKVNSKPFIENLNKQLLNAKTQDELMAINSKIQSVSKLLKNVNLNALNDLVRIRSQELQR